MQGLEITPAWHRAQQFERDWWTAEDRTGDVRKSAPWYAKLLDIDVTRYRGRSILDLGGGPFPIGPLLGLRCGTYTVVDPMPPLPASHANGLDLIRIQLAAEFYSGPLVDEVWGYNVLQHVIDPAVVITTAKMHAAKIVRWFDWTDTKIYPVHPHSITADWLRAQFGPKWRITTDERGTVNVPHAQHYIALVAERIDG